MNNTDTVAMLGYLDRAGLISYKPGMEDAWLDVFAQIPATDARAAVNRVIASGLPDGRFIARPDDILNAVRTVRSDRVKKALDGGALTPPRELDPDDVRAYQAWRKTFLKALGDGQSLRDAEALACDAAGIPVTHNHITTRRPRPALEAR